ncbi:TniQ family protein [Shewanella sp. 0m-8]
MFAKNNVSLILGVRPFPSETESLTQYLLRLAYLNGFFNLSVFLRTIGMNKVKTSRFGLWSEEQLEDLSQALIEALGRNVDDVIELTRRADQNGWLNKAGRVFKELIVDFPRLCPECTIENSVLDWRWSIGVIGRCPTHRCGIIDSCPHCSVPFKWDADLFEYCPSCKKNLVINSEDKWLKTPLSPLEISLWPSPSGYLKINEDGLTDVCNAIYAMARPLDPLRQNWGRIPYSCNHHELVLKAVHLLESQQFYNQWVKFADAEWRMTCLNLNPARLFKASLHNTYGFELKNSWPSMVIEEKTQYVQAARLAYLSRKQVIKPQKHLDVTLLGILLNLEPVSIKQLLDDKVLATNNSTLINSTDVLKDKLFDTEYVLKVFKRFSRKKHIENPLSIDANSTLFATYATTYSALMNAVVNGDIRARFPNFPDLSEIIVNQTQFSSWLLQSLQNACETALPIEIVANVLSENCNDVKLRVKNGDFYWEKWKRNGQAWINGASFEHFLQQDPKSNNRLFKDLVTVTSEAL